MIAIADLNELFLISPKKGGKMLSFAVISSPRVMAGAGQGSIPFFHAYSPVITAVRCCLSITAC